MRKRFALFTAVGLLAALAAPAVGAPQPKTVKVGDYFFSPQKLKVRHGTKVTWRWVGAIVHNVTVTKGPVKFHSRTQKAGSYSHVFTHTGSYTLLCSIHPFMKETISVS